MSTRRVEQALRAADRGEAYHWPTIASILAVEVRRLQSLLDWPHGAGRDVPDEFDGPTTSAEEYLQAVQALCDEAMSGPEHVAEAYIPVSQIRAVIPPSD